MTISDSEGYWGGRGNAGIDTGNGYELYTFGRDTHLVKAWTKGVPVDDKALEQLQNTASMPFIHKHLAVMPDVHWGMGATIGSVIPTKGAIIPAAVGVDIGCGMMACQLPIGAEMLPDNLNAMRSAIEQAIPHGRTNNGGSGDKGAWNENIPLQVAVSWGQLDEDFAAIVEKAPSLRNKNHYNHLGTLGTGNHFIEVNLDERNNVWVMLHSGSRGIGGAIGNYYIEKAKEDMRRWFINLPDTNLAYIPEGSELFDDYWFALDWAQRFAMANRELMMKAAIKSVMNTVYGVQFEKPVELNEFKMVVNAHHNYVAREHHFGENVLVTRKGAIRARKGDLGIIPGSMGAKSYIVRGLGNDQSFHSASHGAGRVLSRNEAKRIYTVDDLAQAMNGIESRLDADVIDEIPQAYKDIDAVMEAQKDLVEVVHTLKQVLVVKG
jgi:tRNA-splicing ligase RtcB